MGADAGGAGQPSGGDPFEGLTLDEEFVRAATIKEPSARAMMLADQWQREPLADLALRPPVRPARRRPRLLPLVATVVGLAVAAVVVLLAAPGTRDALVGWATSTRRTISAEELAEQAGPGPAVPSPAPAPELDPARPFAGSPAEDYADGAAGIVLPAARATGEFSAREVAAALQGVKRHLVASRLDPRVLHAGATEPVLSLLDADISRRDAATSLARPSPLFDPGLWLTRFDPAGVEPVGSVVKVHGTVRYELTGRDELTIRTDHLFVHPVQRRGDPRSARRVVVRVVTEYVAYAGASAGRPVVIGTWYNPAGVECGAGLWLRPDFTPSGPPAGPADDPYEQEPVEAVPGTGECGTATRT